MGRFLYATMLLVFIAMSGCSSVVNRFYTWTPEIDKPLENIANRDGPYKISIHREFQNELEEKLLALIESTYPLYPGSILLGDFVEPKAGAQPRWWSSEVDGLRIPATVTRAALDYYLDFVHRLQTETSATSSSHRPQTAHLEYIGVIQPAKEALDDSESIPGLDDKFIVQLRMSWISDCGKLCGLEFTRNRIVVIERDGSVLEHLENPLAPIRVE